MIAACIAIVLLTALLAYREYLHTQERLAATEERAQLLDRIESPGVVPVQRRIDNTEPLPPSDSPYENPWSAPPPPEED